MALSSNKYAFIAPRLEKIMAQNTAPKVPEWQSYGKFRKVTLNPDFSEKVERGDQGKFFKNRPKKSPRLKGLKVLCRKWHYPLISILSKCKDWARFWRKKRVKECPNCQVMAIFAWSPKTRILWKSLKGGARKIFQKSPRKFPRLNGLRPLWRKWHYPPISMHLKCKDWRRFWRKHRLQTVPEWPSQWDCPKVTQNPHFLKKCKGESKWTFPKIALKVAFA